MESQPRGDLRGLKALVGILGVLIVLGTALVIGVIIHRIYAKQPAPSMAAATAPGTAPAKVAAAVALPAGDYIKSIAAAGADLAIWVGGTDGDKVLLVNPATGSITVAISASQ